ncbi:MAG: TlpA disulfide reductase family protein [Acidobacteriota bacterium]
MEHSHPVRPPTCSLLLSLATVLLFSGCAEQDPERAAVQLVGTWRAVLESPGGDLPFLLRIDDDGPRLRGVVVNGSEEALITAVERRGRNVVFRFDVYDSEITAELENRDRMTGRWRKTAAGGEETLMAFAAVRDGGQRFGPASESGPGALESIGGHWAVEFTDEDGTEPARGEFEQQGPLVRGTFLTPVGDYRFLEGWYENGYLRLSTFDGAHAFLFDARVQEDGTLVGNFWSRDTYHATWTGRPAAEGEVILPNAWELAGLTNDEGSFSFSFPDLDGKTVSLDDPRFENKVVLVNIFGSWCPNCNDEAPLLAAWYHRYRDRGFEVVGLAYELTGDPERDVQQVRRFAARHAVDYPLLLAGTSDKQAAGATLPDLSAVVAFPTSVFIGRDGKVRKIHSGFAGPGTGRHHSELVSELEGLIQGLVAEP